MSKEYFITREEAVEDLNKRKEEVRERLEAKGEKILGDGSFVYSAELFGEPERHVTKDGVELWSRKGLGEYVWYSCVSLITQSMKDDIEKLSSLDVIAELEAAMVNEMPKEINRGIIDKVFKLNDKNKEDE